MVIGLTGANASGKGEVALYLTRKGFKYHSLSDILREEAKSQGTEPSRENLIKLGNSLRAKEGPWVLVTRIKKDLTTKDNHIVDSIRNPYEIEALREMEGFKLWGIDAPVELRFKRALKRKREGYLKTLEEFKERELRENIDEPTNQQLANCLKYADKIIINNSTLEELYKIIDEAIKSI